MSVIQSHHHHERSHPHRCAPPEDLIVDALHVPMPHVRDTGEHSPHLSAGPTLWLTSSLAPLSLNTVFDTFSKKQIETIVQHLDPILQNSNMQKIVSFISNEVADALNLFSSSNYPNVISLRDMEFAQWGEKCIS